ncbi:hypothetical protein HL670_04804 [Serratia plymuthica]|uniref:hypothetical protein n=1 Tax=Serratia plymuthica TaxID=82996 RepID=UPI000788B262|nr:hypothetical protein [Serratia plymuthica]QJW57881.1 hypothetical protein HL670_04804 [Serratia plymuthica]
MIDFDLMVKNEDMGDVILFLVGRSDNGIAYPFMDRFFGRHKADDKYEAYNIKLIKETKRLESIGQIFSARTYGSGYKKGPNWKAPKFVTEKKYGIE